MVRQRVGVDGESLRPLSRIRSCRRSHRRVQRQVHVQPVGATRRILCHSPKPHTRDLPQLLPAPGALAIHGHKACKMIASQPLVLPAYAEEVARGLTARRKHLPCKLFYDEAGSALFEEITQLPEYYLTRTELEILEEYSPEIIQTAGAPVSVIELGAGTAMKTRTLLRAVARRQLRVKYFPVDISGSALGEAQARVRQEFPGALIRPMVADFVMGSASCGRSPAASWCYISAPASEILIPRMPFEC